MDVEECFDNVSVACMETLKKKAIADSGFKKMEPLLDWCYSLIDGQFQAGIAEVCKEDIVDVVSLIEKGETAHTVVKELSDALDAANEQADQAADTQQKVMPRLSWRQLARVNSDENGDGEATRLALQNEREDRIRGFASHELLFHVQSFTRPIFSDTRAGGLGEGGQCQEVAGRGRKRYILDNGRPRGRFDQAPRRQLHWRAE